MLRDYNSDVAHDDVSDKYFLNFVLFTGVEFAR